MSASFVSSLARRARRHRIAVALGVVFFALFLARDALALAFLRHRLQSLPEIEISVGALHLGVWPAGATVRQVRVLRRQDALPKLDSQGQRIELAFVQKARVRLIAGCLLQGAVCGDAEVDGVSAALWRVPRSAKAKRKPGEPQAVPEPPPADHIAAAWPQIARFVMPVRIESVQVQNARFVLHDLTTEPPVHFAVEGGQLCLENLSNREKLAEGNYARVRASATPAGGRFSLRMELDPMAPTPTFALRSSVKNVSLPVLNPLLVAYTHLDVCDGRFSAEVGLRCQKGRYDGTIEPTVENLEIRKRAEDKERDTLLNRAYRGLARVATALVKNSEHDAIATRLPLRGQFVEPSIGVWEAVVTLLGNAYIDALTPDVNLPSKGQLKASAPSTEQRKTLRRGKKP